MKAVLISIQPKWAEKICKGEKTIEVRKTRPKLETPFKCYIYETKWKIKMNELVEEYSCTDGNLTLCKRKRTKKVCNEGGKVIGEFVCNEIEYIAEHQVFNGKAFMEQSCLTIKELFNYTKKGFYCWHISDLKIYDKPKELSEFSKPFVLDNRPIKDWCHNHCEICEETNCKYDLRIKRPPQSWCYCENLGERLQKG